MSGPFWDRFEREANEAFSYLVENVDHMTEGERVRHFSIMPSWNGCRVVYHQQVKQAYHGELESAVLFLVCQERDT